MSKTKTKTVCPKCTEEMQKVGIHKPIFVCTNAKCKTKMEQLTLF